MRAKGLGANVIVAEVDNFCALQAAYDGFRVMKMEDACRIGDIFCTLTGDKHVIRTEHLKQMKDGAVLANSGHFDIEIDVKGLKEIASSERRVRPFLDEYVVNGKKIFLCGEGRLVNLAAAEGHPSEVMSTSFCGQVLACEYLAKNRGKLNSEVIMLPGEIDDTIAGLQLEAMKIEIDELTEEQKKYLSSWQEGT
jgi:adenosylhomocysteinase